MASTEMKPSVHVSFHYTKRHKSGFRIFYDETIIFSRHDEAEDEAALKYLGQKIATAREYYMYVVRVEDKGYKNCDGATVLKTTNCKMFQRELFNPTVTEIKEWDGDSYNRGRHFADNRATLKELREEIEVQRNWVEF